MKALLTIKEVHSLVHERCADYKPCLRTLENLRRRNRRYLRHTKRGGRVFYCRTTAENFCVAINQGKVK
jgi:hypothetical protein